MFSIEMCVYMEKRNFVVEINIAYSADLLLIEFQIKTGQKSGSSNNKNNSKSFLLQRKSRKLGK